MLLSSGAANKIFLLTFDKERQVIARIPCGNTAGPAHLCTASEVATMEFARTVLSLPVPKVLAYSSRADSTPVGCEFIIMEVASGSEFGQLARGQQGTRLPDLERCVEDTAGIVRTWCETPFSQIGSLFFKEDVSDSLRQRPLYAPGAPASLGGADRFRIGPSVNREFWRGKRELLDVDRGPCE